VAIDTLAYVKALEAAGLDRSAAEAQAEALIRHILPDLATKADLDALEGRLDQRFERLDQRFEQLEQRFEQLEQHLEQRLDYAVQRLEQRHELVIEQSEHRITIRTFGLVLGIVGLMDSILFVLLRLVR
jgi:ferritin-like metal-binding protein YciE